jgi:hypothetical protein
MLPRPATVLVKLIGVFILLIYPSEPSPATVLTRLRVLTYPLEPRPITVLIEESEAEDVRVDSVELFAYCKVLKEGTRLLTVQGL